MTTLLTEVLFGREAVEAARSRLASHPVEVTDAVIVSLGDMAAAFGRGLAEVVDAVSEAMSGDFDGLRRFGFRVEVDASLGRVELTLRGVKTVVALAPTTILAFLVDTAASCYAGATELQCARGGAAS